MHSGRGRKYQDIHDFIDRNFYDERAQHASEWGAEQQQAFVSTVLRRASQDDRFARLQEDNEREKETVLDTLADGHVDQMNVWLEKLAEYYLVHDESQLRPGFFVRYFRVGGGGRRPELTNGGWVVRVDPRTRRIDLRGGRLRFWSVQSDDVVLFRRITPVELTFGHLVAKY